MSEESRKSSVTVRIAGEQYAIRSSVNPEHTLRCAQLVEERIQEVQQQSGVVDRYRAVILAALSIADEQLRMVRELEALREGAEVRAGALADRVEAELAADALDPDGVGSEAEGER